MSSLGSGRKLLCKLGLSTVRDPWRTLRPKIARRVAVFLFHREPSGRRGVYVNIAYPVWPRRVGLTRPELSVRVIVTSADRSDYRFASGVFSHSLQSRA